MRLENLFAIGREKPRGFVLADPRFFAEFDGETSFVLQQNRSNAGGSIIPVTDGYFVANHDGGTDILLRTALPRWTWGVEAAFALFLALSAAFSKGAIYLFVIFFFALFFALVNALIIMNEGSTFARRIEELFLSASSAPLR